MQPNGTRRGRGPGRRPKLILPCTVCSEPFRTYPSVVKAGNGKFCSLACFAEAERERVIPLPDRFWLYVRKDAGCWEWIGGSNVFGYGKISNGTSGSSVAAHIAAWQIASGQSVASGLIVGHTCDNPPCVRNNDPGTYEINGVLVPRWGHLWLGTQQQNMLDMHAKGRRDKRRNVSVA